MACPALVAVTVIPAGSRVIIRRVGARAQKKCHRAQQNCRSFHVAPFGFSAFVIRQGVKARNKP
jgi:hypothetical protein